MGLNTIATYVFWNYHEVRPGVFDFHSGNRDLAAFIRMAQDEGLWVILRPGPYVCAEWDFGGLPSYLLKTPKITVRGRDPRYLEAATRYVNELAREVRPLLVTHGGPILMVQSENEYGSFGTDSIYKEATREMLVNAGMDVPLFTADGDWLLAKGGIPGVFAAANGEMNYDTLAKRMGAFNHGNGPLMIAELYPGWLTHWAEPFPATPVDSFLPQYDSLLKRAVSINLYMFHGGTNFGFTSGANYTRAIPIEPSMTSYDYDAPLSEAGWPTPKFFALRDVIRRDVSYAIPPMPDSPPVVAIPSINVTPIADLFAIAGRVVSVKSVEPLSFEDLDQANGYIMYRHVVDSAMHGIIAVPGLRDFAEVFVDGRRVATLDRRTKVYSAPIALAAHSRLDIFVENMGRINYGADLVNNRKGIIEPVTVNGVELRGWSMYRLPFDSDRSALGVSQVHGSAPGIPTLYRGTFTIRNTGDTFLDMRSWKRGIVFVNGRNLGRYWDVGPQQTLYVPGVWLRRGVNRLVVFDLEGGAPRPVAGLKKPILTELYTESVVIPVKATNVIAAKAGTP
jgi:beta-galactosidase